MRKKRRKFNRRRGHLAKKRAGTAKGGACSFKDASSSFEEGKLFLLGAPDQEKAGLKGGTG